MHKKFDQFAIKVYDSLVFTGIGANPLIPSSIRRYFADHYRDLQNGKADGIQSPSEEAFNKIWLGDGRSAHRKITSIIESSLLSTQTIDYLCRLIWEGTIRGLFELDDELVSKIDQVLCDHRRNIPDGAIAQLIAAISNGKKEFDSFLPSLLATEIATYSDGHGRSIHDSKAEAIGTIRFTLPEIWLFTQRESEIPFYLNHEIFLWVNWLQLSRDFVTFRYFKNIIKRRGRKRGKQFDLNNGDLKSALALLANVNIAKSGSLKTAIKRSSKASEGNSVCYLLHNSLPWDLQGYATRSHGLINSLNSHDWTAIGITRQGYPLDRHTNLMGYGPDDSFEADGVTYYRLGSRNRFSFSLPYLNSYAQVALDLISEFDPKIIHAASNAINGIVAAKVAKELDVPVVYEVRGLWEITGMSREPGYAFTAQFRLSVKLENLACELADHVFTLTSALKDELMRRGTPSEKISLLPNCVDANRFVPRNRNFDLANRVGVSEKTVIGYIGSLLHYEGLNLLLEAVYLLSRLRNDFKVLIVGSGIAYDDLVRQTQAMGLSDVVIFTGRVPHEQVEDYYSLIDIAPFPRRALPVCEMVSPLKPFEAMAMAKVPLVSSVAALAEIVQNGETGMIFEKENVRDFAEKITWLLDNPVERTKIGKQARQWVLENRTWEHNAQKIQSIYDTLLRSK